MATEKIDEILANLKDLGAAVNRLEQNDVSVKCRLAELEDRIENSTTNEGESHVSPSVYERECHTETVHSAPNQTHSHSGDNVIGQPSDLYDLNTVAGDPQNEFNAIRDAVSKLKLPENLRLNESKKGIRRKDQATHQVLSRSARFVETNFKLLSTLAKLLYMT